MFGFQRQSPLRSSPRPARGPLSTDPALGVCLGEVDLADGLLHFEDETGPRRHVRRARTLARP